MIFTSRFGALAARPTFDRVDTDTDVEFQRELDQLLDGAELEPADER